MNMGRASRHEEPQGLPQERFLPRSRDRLAKEIIEKGGTEREREDRRSSTLSKYKALLGAMQSMKYLAPQTECLSPIGEALIRKGLKNVLDDVKPEFYAPPVTRSPRVFAGQPVPGRGRHRLRRRHPRRPAGAHPTVREPRPAALSAGGLRPHQSGRGGRLAPLRPGAEGRERHPVRTRDHPGARRISTKVPFTSEAKEAVATIPRSRRRSSSPCVSAAAASRST